MDNFEQVIYHIARKNQEKNAIFAMKWPNSRWLWEKSGWVLKYGWGKGKAIAKSTSKNMVTKDSSIQCPKQHIGELWINNEAEPNDSSKGWPRTTLA